MSMSTYTTHDLDKNDPYEEARRKILSEKSQNFALYFDHEQAVATCDLQRSDLAQWMQDHENKPGAKWIHFWADKSQSSLIQDLASKYDISPRLIGLLLPQKAASRPPPVQQSPRQAPNGHLPILSRARKGSRDIESAANGIPLSHRSSGTSVRKNISFGDVVDDLWHFHSVDWGQNYIHIGVNVLSPIPGVKYKADKPAGRRLWNSIILCHDGTVISTLERPQPFDSPEIAKDANDIIKCHTLGIFSQMSRLPSSFDNSNYLMNVRVRPESNRADSTAESINAQRNESASLLFYYLFDDWMSTYALIARREHPYRDNLEQVRQDLTHAPNAHVLETLHNIGRQLMVLRLMYQSYAKVLTRILDVYSRVAPSAAESGAQPGDGTPPNDGIGRTPNIPRMPGNSSSSERPNLLPKNGTDQPSSVAMDLPTITQSALFRFQRLLDRIDLYALSEINECISEKESLSFMTINLLTLSEAHTVEKLTRTTILLAKATILFLPVSLMTAYFSIQVGNLEEIYSLRTYWFSFLVITILSILFLLGFGTATGTVEGHIVYKSLHRALWQKGIASLMRGKSKGN